MENSFCHRLPKVELHAHLNGSLTESTLQELFEYQLRAKLNLIDTWNSSILSQDGYTLSEFFEIFEITYQLTSVPKTVQIAVERVIEDFSGDNVIYLELRSTLRAEKNMTKKEYIESIIKGIFECRKKFPNITVKLIVSVNRGESVESGKENVHLAIEYKTKHPDIIVGVDLSGNPHKGSFNDFISILNVAREKGLKITVHCAEIIDNNEVKEVLDFHPDRIGHGTCIHRSYGGNESNWTQLLHERIPVELCLTSNFKSHTVKLFAKHHFTLLYPAKHPITLGTDDKGMFQTTLSKEFDLVQNIFGLSDEEIWQLSYNSIDYIFGTEKEKEALKEKLLQWRIRNVK